MSGKISNFDQIASLRRYKLLDGNEEGLEVIECNNGKIMFLLNVSKALDVMQLYHEGTNISFISKNGFTKREIPFLRRFEGGMLYTCGLDSVGGREGYELHGTIHNSPAKFTHCECNEEGIVVEAIIKDTSLFGKNLILKRRIYSAIESESLEICDSLIKSGYKDEEYCLLYHVNLGYPMVDKDATIIADITSYKPRTPWAKENENTMLLMEDAKLQDETCYFLNLNKPCVSLVNNKLRKQFTICYSKDTLPHFVEWKSMVVGDYALGLEPCTTELDDQFKYKTIKSNEVIDFSLTLTIKNI